MQTIPRQKLNAEFRKYTILGARNPPFDYQALRAVITRVQPGKKWQ